MRAHLSVLALAVLALACGGEDKPRLEVATQGSEFVRGGTDHTQSVAIPYTVTNRGNATAFISSCNGHPLVSLESGTGTGWVQTSAAACLAIYLSAPIELRAGQSITDSFYFPDPGVFRLALSYASTASAATSGQSETAASGAFTVR